MSWDHRTDMLYDSEVERILYPSPEIVYGRHDLVTPPPISDIDTSKTPPGFTPTPEMKAKNPTAADDSSSGSETDLPPFRSPESRGSSVLVPRTLEMLYRKSTPPKSIDKLNQQASAASTSLTSSSNKTSITKRAFNQNSIGDSSNISNFSFKVPAPTKKPRISPPPLPQELLWLAAMV